MAGRWPRDAWQRAVWASDLRPLPRLIALAYADHAIKEVVVWVTIDRLVEVTGMSRDAVIRNHRALVGAGWLELVERGRQHRASRYRLTYPAVRETDGSAVRETDGWAKSSSTGAAPSSTGDDASSTGDVPDCSSTTQQTAAARARDDDDVELDDLLSQVTR